MSETPVSETFTCTLDHQKFCHGTQNMAKIYNDEPKSHLEHAGYHGLEHNIIERETRILFLIGRG